MLIPRFIKANGLIPFLEQLASCADADRLDLDFTHLESVSPAGLVALTAFVAHRRRRGLPTDFIGFDHCRIASYLRRMNLPQQCGISVADDGRNAHDPRGRFLPLEEVDHPVEKLGTAFAEIIAPGGDDYGHPNSGLFDTAWYLITEMANNVRQHSGGRGFIAAQPKIADGFIRIAIGDCGCGIPRSLRDAGMASVQEVADEDAIERALEARISCKGSPTNEGVGLTFSARLIEMMGGHLLIASGAGLHMRVQGLEPKKQSFPAGTRFPGTLIAMTFRRSAAGDFDKILAKAKELEIPLRPSCSPVSFEP